MSHYNGELEEISDRNLNDTTNQYFAVVFVGEIGNYDETLVAEINRGEEDYWKLAGNKKFSNLHEAYNYRDFLRAKPMERIKMMKEKGVTLFPSLSEENKKALLYIDDEPENPVGFYKK